MAYEILLAFAVGFASFLSPCILPIVPGFISSLAGSVSDEVKKTRKSVVVSTIFFVLGFAVVFALLGTIIACFCGPGSVTGVLIKSIITFAGGFVIIAFGIFLILSTKIPRLNFEYLTQEKVGRRIRLTKQKTNYITSWIFGATFAAGWTPCVGPLLGSILALAAIAPAAAYNSLLAYALGLGIPFIIISLFFVQLTPVLRRLVKYTKYFDLVMGAILILIGLGFLGVHISVSVGV